MMVCFGFAWPFSIYKSYKSKSNKGKSLWFLVIVLTGYSCGIIHKVFYNFDYVIILYALNFMLVFADSCLYFRNYLLERAKI
jgi:hypothetical protein